MKKVFGIISYFPDEDSECHIKIRKERSRRYRELLFKLDELWSDVDIMVIAQNWQDFELPQIRNKIIPIYYGKLGITGARKELRKRFLNSDYEYLIMLDDDAILSASDPQKFLDELDNHPDGFGYVRKEPEPLSLFAISEVMYNQVDMSNVEPERGVGFGDMMFISECFRRFPDKGFKITTVSEISLGYTGFGKCPSTWRNEKVYNWAAMYENTKAMVENSRLVDDLETSGSSIDVIISYVNGADSNWVKDYIQATNSHNPTAVRFRSWGTLKYLFRGIAAYMPFVRNIVLVVARPSQVPVWVDRNKVRIVYHKDYIPEKFLPTFNSCTIESFFWNIEGLADRIIYFNDDMFPIEELSENDFFTGNLPHIKFSEPTKYSHRNMFRSQCRSGMDFITRTLQLPAFEHDTIIRPIHISSAFAKESFTKIKDLCSKTIEATVSPLRMPKNVNQYIYSYYHYFTNTYVDEVFAYKYEEISDTTIKEIATDLISGQFKMLCLNDSDKIHDYSAVKYQLNQAFERKFPKKCKYEQ